MKTIFVVDDSTVNLTMAKQALEDKYQVLTLPSAAKMFTLLEKVMPDLILLDIQMPEEDGFSAIEKLKKNKRTENVPVMFLTASMDEKTEAHGLSLGAVDFVSKPVSPAVLNNRISHHIHIDEMIRDRTKRLERLQNSVLSVVADMVESRDKITGWHVERTTAYVRILIESMRQRGVYVEDMKNWDLDRVVPSARLHDLGKIAISDLILNKPSKLTTEEFEKIKTHATEGEQIIDHMIARTGEEIFLHHAKLFAGYHHERWDGKGYPHGLAGTSIPLEGRIMAIADVFDVLVSERPYKKAFSYDEAVSIIMADAGKHFDPNIVEVFYEERHKFKEVLMRLCH
ncbi:MAG: response regulator [Fibromonadaceae bacterium]|jgi:putative two-component system response regulator|nr:response regulator [Fibromonadaceae bacterium]